MSKVETPPGIELRLSEEQQDQPQVQQAEALSATKQRRSRTRFSLSQQAVLQSVFRSTRYPDSQMRQMLAAKIGLDESKVQVWFQNHRALVKRKQRTKQPAAEITSSTLSAFHHTLAILAVTEVGRRTRQPILYLPVPAASSQSTATINLGTPVSSNGATARHAIVNWLI